MKKHIQKVIPKVKYFLSESQRKDIDRKTLIFSSKKRLALLALVVLGSTGIGLGILQHSKDTKAATISSLPNAQNPQPMVDQLWQNVTAEGPVSSAESAPYNQQLARPDSLTAVASPKNGIAKYSGLFTVKTGDQPGSTSGYRT